MGAGLPRLADNTICDPEQLKVMAFDSVEQVARETGIITAVEHSEHFRPGRPEPTHRMAMP